MNEDQRDEQNREYAVAFDRDARKREFDYWIVLNTRNIASQPFVIRKPIRSAISTPTFGDSRSPATARDAPDWKKHFAIETDLFHPRAELRKMPKSLGRHYSYWTGQELHDVHTPRFLRQVAKANQGPIRFGGWIEYGDWNGRPHVNLALGKVKGLSKRTLANIWKGMNGGRSEIRRFDKKSDTGYLYKMIGKGPYDAAARSPDLLWMANYWRDDHREAA